MRASVRKHPVIIAILCVTIVLLVFTIYTFRSASKGMGAALSLGDKVAIIEINGLLVDSKGIIEQIHSVKKNKSVKAVVVRINSPGGGVSPSQDIYSELKRLGNDKRVVASLSSIAASGGYYIASAAEKIVASPGTLTGSIGVIMDFSNFEGLLEKLGLKSYVVKSGKYKDIGSPARDMTDEERSLLQKVIDNVHDQFVDAVAEGRRMDRDEVKKIADGRIFSGEQAFGLGLVDKLGNLQDSISLAADLAGIKGEPRLYYTEKKKGFFDYLFGSSVESIIKQISIPQLMYKVGYL